MRKRGFTLVELLVVITVLAILTVTIVPQFGGSYQGALLRASGSELIAVMNLASSQAVITGYPHRLRFDLTEKRYWLEALREDVDGGQRRYRRVRDLPGVRGQLNRQIGLRVRKAGETSSASQAGQASWRSSPSLAAVEFRPDRTADSKELLLTDGDGFTLALRVNPYTSVVRLLPRGRMNGPNENR